jgi:translation initiation factor eIF-2B subunit gamma
MGMDTIKSKMEKEKSFSFGRSFTEKHDNFRLLTGYRDAHLYFFPYWVKDLIRRQERLDSVKEDLIVFGLSLNGSRDWGKS